MFRTYHLNCRIRYETDKVVCIDVYANKRIYDSTPMISEGEFITQVLLSLVNKQYHYDNSLNDLLSPAGLNDFNKEFQQGINRYLEAREILELDKPKEGQI